MRFHPGSIAAIAAATFVAAPLCAGTLTVAQNDPSCDDAAGTPFCSIQAAIDAAGAGDVVEVLEGIYDENIVINVPDLVLVGVDAVIRGSFDSPVITVGANGVAILDLELRKGSAGIEAFTVDGLTINGNLIWKADGNGISLSGIGHTVNGNEIEENEGTGLQLGAANEATSTGNSLTVNEIGENGGHGIHLINADGNQLTENEMEEHEEGVGLLVEDSSDNAILVNEFEENLTQVHLVGTSTGNLLQENEFEEGLGDGILAEAAGGNTMVDNFLLKHEGAGFNIASANNHLQNNFSKKDFRGYRVSGTLNTLIDNVAVKSVKEGYRIDGDANMFVTNQAKKGSAHGFRVGGADNTLMGNTARANAKHGYLVKGNMNEFMDNHAAVNGKWGYKMSNDLIANTFEGNTCSDNSSGPSNPNGLCASP